MEAGATWSAHVEKDKEATTTHVPGVLVGARCTGTQATMGGEEAWTYDIPWSEGEVSDLAQQVKHPFRRKPTMPDTVKEAAVQITVGGPTAVAERAGKSDPSMALQSS